MKRLVQLFLLSISLAFLAQPAFAESKAKSDDDGIAVCKSVNEDGKAAGSMEKMAPSIALGAKGAKPCCGTPDGATCYAYNCAKCRKLCKPRKLPGAADEPAKSGSTTGK